MKGSPLSLFFLGHLHQARSRVVETGDEEGGRKGERLFKSDSQLRNCSKSAKNDFVLFVFFCDCQLVMQKTRFENLKAIDPLFASFFFHFHLSEAQLVRNSGEWRRRKKRKKSPNILEAREREREIREEEDSPASPFTQNERATWNWRYWKGKKEEKRRCLILLFSFSSGDNDFACSEDGKVNCSS